MKKILFVIDYQNDFVNGALGFDGAENLDLGIAEKIREYGEGNVWYTLDTHYEDYLETREGKNLPVTHCMKGSSGWQVYGETAKALKEVNAVCIEKLSFGIDTSKEEVNALLPEIAHEIELVGLVSNICVISNAVVLQSRYPGATITVNSALTDSFDKSLNEATMDVLRGLQTKVI